MPASRPERVARGDEDGVERARQLLLAVQEGNVDRVRTLLSVGAPFSVDWLSNTALHLAAREGHSEMCQLLLGTRQICPNATNRVGRTPLHEAAARGHEAVCRALLGAGEKADVQDILGMTPLHWAVKEGNEEVVLLLLSFDAPTSLRSKFFLTPVDLAIEAGRDDLASLLERREVQTAIDSILAEGTGEGSASPGTQSMPAAKETPQKPLVEAGSNEQNCTGLLETPALNTKPEPTETPKVPLMQAGPSEQCTESALDIKPGPAKVSELPPEQAESSEQSTSKSTGSFSVPLMQAGLSEQGTAGLQESKPPKRRKLQTKPQPSRAPSTIVLHPPQQQQQQQHQAPQILELRPGVQSFQQPQVRLVCQSQQRLQSTQQYIVLQQQQVPTHAGTSPAPSLAYTWSCGRPLLVQARPSTVAHVPTGAPLSQGWLQQPQQGLVFLGQRVGQLQQETLSHQSQ